MKRLGIDVGGSRIKIGIVENGIILKKEVMNYQFDETNLVNSLALFIKKHFTDFKYIGIGSPGSVKNGVIYNACNLNIKELNIKQGLRKHFNGPIYVENDAYVNLLGELRYGSLKDAHNAILLTLGTGVGGGVIINKEIYVGSKQVAGEFGHVIYERNGLQCKCGKRGCFEMYASTNALIREVEKNIGREVDGEFIFDAIKNKNPLVTAIFDTYTSIIAEGLDDFLNILDVDTVCISGGISEMKDYLSTPIQDKINHDVKVVTSHLGNNAGIIGAACLGNEEYE